MPSVKNFCKKNSLSSRISQNDVNEMVRVAVKEVKVIIIIIIVILFYHYRAVGKLRIFGEQVL